MSDRPTEIYRAANAQHAQLLKGMLEERGIQAFVVNDKLQAAGGDLPLGWTAAPQILVSLDDAPKARQIAEEFDARMRHEGSVALGELDDALDFDWTDWPLCPSCGERRQALCQICGTSGNKFPYVDTIQSQGHSKVLLHCESCDDHFQPAFFRTCHHCGHDYGDGIESQVPLVASDLPENSSRTWLILGALVAFGVLMAGYFVWLTNR